MPSISVHGASVFYRRHPARASEHADELPLLLIHGAGGTLTHWPPHLRRLSGRIVFAPDLPGHGQSTGPGMTSIAGHATWLVALLDALHLDRVVLAGHSMGGAIALDVARRFPTRVAALALLATGPTLRVAPALLDGLRTDFAATTARIARLAYARTVADASVAAYAAQLQTVDPALLIADFQACDAFDRRGQLADIAAPTLIVVGMEDRMTPPALSRALHAGLPTSTLITLDGVGHMLMLEQEATVMAELDTFLKTHSHG